jgi:hypothetical protein
MERMSVSLLIFGAESPGAGADGDDRLVFAIDDTVMRLATLAEVQSYLGGGRDGDEFLVRDPDGGHLDIAADHLGEIVAWAERKLLLRPTPTGRRSRLSSLSA